jgi:hypothetical protein
MKGPMTTQTLRGLEGLEPFHWRGDREDFPAFNPAFDSLMGGAPLAAEDMAAFRDFVNTLRFQPNPNQNLDRTLPSALAGGDPNAGRRAFLGDPSAVRSNLLEGEFRREFVCNDCHLANPGPGTKGGLSSADSLHLPQLFKFPQLRNLYQKLSFDNRPGATSVGGFGLTHDGSFASVIEFLSQPVFPALANEPVKKADLNAFLQTFDTGTAPAVGYTRTIGPASANDAAADGDWSLLEQQAAVGNIDLIAKGTVDGQLRGLLYRPGAGDYLTDKAGLGEFTRAQLRARLAAGDTLSFMGVPPGSGVRMGIDRDLDGTLDGD